MSSTALPPRLLPPRLAPSGLRLIFAFGALLWALVFFLLSFEISFGTESLYYLLALLFD